MCYNKRPKYSLEERMRAHRWEKVCEANSYLSYMLERDLDWMYEIGEAYYHAEHIDEFESCSAMFKGELHTFRYILSELEKENAIYSVSLIIEEKTWYLFWKNMEMSGIVS